PPLSSSLSPLLSRRPLSSTLFPYTTLFRSAFYIFPDISFTGIEDWDFATALLKDQHLAVVPGSAFSEHGKGHIRISFASAIETLDRKSTRLNSSHVSISYAVFCLKKKINNK